jgi:chloramphenicol 3-O phosphotransferase
MTLYIGDSGKKVITGMHEAIACYAKTGNNVIVDYILYDPGWCVELDQKLFDVPHYWVKMDIDLEILDQREKARCTSPVGHPRSHYFIVHDNIKYDYVVNCNIKTSAELAVEFKNKINKK